MQACVDCTKLARGCRDVLAKAVVVSANCDSVERRTTPGDMNTLAKRQTEPNDDLQGGRWRVTTDAAAGSD